MSYANRYNDPAWKDAHDRLLDESGTPDEVMVRQLMAAFDLYRIEVAQRERGDAA